MHNIKKAIFSDIEDVAKLHREVFTDHFLGKLSINLLAKFYKNYLTPNIIFFVSRDNSDQKLLGFIVGGDLNVLNESKREFLTKNWTKLFAEILFMPNLWKDSLIRIPHKKIKSKVTPMRLLSIAVGRSYQKQNIGNNLVTSYESEVLKKGELQYGLSVHSNNLNAINFYKRMGFTIENATSTSISFIKTISK